MASGVQHQTGKASSPDRACKVSASLEYKVIRGRRIVGAGRGTTVNISSSGIVFKPASPIPVGLKIEAYVDFPSRPENDIATKLHVHGETVERSVDAS